MRRDMDLVRSILLQAESAGCPLALGQISHEGHTDEETVFHIRLMEGRGLISARVQTARGGEVLMCEIESLTWEGLDFLDAVRSERVWSRVRRAISESVGDTTLDVVKSACATVASRLVMEALSKL